MNRSSKILLTAILTVTIASVVTWQATGGDWYTKYQIVEQVESQPDPNDPLAAAGFYEGNSPVQTVTRDEFRFGLLPTPSGIFDRHVLSVASVTGPLWVFGLGFMWLQWRRTKRNR
ncbi:MAG: hypothetical protein Kow0074_16840 [Candidatus Zixiibacteriota bacterium]